MRLTALDIRNHRFSARLRGLDPAEVEAFVRLIAEDVESLVRERDKLRQQVRGLEARVEELSTNERTLQDTLVTAQAISDDLKKTAMKEAEVRISESEVSPSRSARRAPTSTPSITRSTATTEQSQRSARYRPGQPHPEPTSTSRLPGRSSHSLPSSSAWSIVV